MKRIIITGATGFVGSNLTRRLLRDGHEIHLLVRRDHQSWRIEGLSPQVHIHETNLTSKDELAGVIAEIKPEWIFHLAVYGAYSWQTDLHQMVQTNIVGTMNLLDACLKTGFDSFVNTGTSSEYGYKDHPPLETECLEPNSCYAVTKASATIYCRYIAQTRGVSVSTLRLYSTYGPFEDPGRLIPTLAVKGLSGELPPLVSSEIAHDFVFVDDVVDAYLLATTNNDQEYGAIYNVGTGKQISIGEIVSFVQKILQINTEPVWGSMPDREWDTKTWVADSQKLQTELGWKPKYTFEQGFRQMIEWFQSNPSYLSIYKQRIC
jgi:UDP-glucose 4-epimerase